MRREQSEIAILGGGIAGLSTAIALRLAGQPATVYERRSVPSEHGAGLVCWPNASFILNDLGVLPMLEAHAGAPTAMERRTMSDEFLGAVDIAALSAEAGEGTYSVLRKDLYASLRQRLDALGGKVHYGYEARTVLPSENGAVVEFANGARIAPTVILGAEGRMASAARRYVLGQDSPRYQGFVNWIGVVEMRAPVFADMQIQDIWGVGLRFGIVPISPRRAYWAAGQAQDAPEPVPLAQRPEMLRALFGCWPPSVQAIVGSDATKACHEIHVYDHDHTSVWHRDNVLLLGDAAHAALPTSGQGACQALEDAWHLAKHLRILGESSDLEQQFTNFTEKRRAKTRQITNAGRSLAKSLFNTAPAACEARNTAAKATDYAALSTGMAQFWMQGLPLEGITSGPSSR